MSEQPNPASNSTPVVEIDSGDEAEYPSHTSNSPRLRRENVIELLSDASDTDDDDEVQIIAENNTPADPDDIQITGETQNHFPGFGIVFPGGPEPRVVSRNSPSRPRQRPRDDSFSRNVRRRPNPVQSRNFYRAAFLRGTPDLPVISHPDIPAMLAEHQHQLLHYFHSHEGEVSSAIMERIRREEERSLDRKMESENKHNRTVLERKKEVAHDELEGYTNDISDGDNLMCELCGTVLGEGIPDDFEPNVEYDEHLEQHAAEAHVMAPWFCMRQCFDTDRELSKRVFAARCGHVFCGRCVKNIGNRPPAKRGKARNDITILNPQISAPRKCPAKGCAISFNKSKKTFTELFL